MTRPLFSVLTPVYKTPLDFLEACIASVERQTIPDWELLLVDDGNDRALKRWLKDRCRRDPRLRVVTAVANGGIAKASQLGVDHAEGEFLALLDHDDTLSPIALERMAARILEFPQVDYLYSDEDKISASDDHYDAFFKPGWSPERFRHHNYTCHLSVLRTDLVRAVGGFRPGFDGSQDYDLFLRVIEQARQVEHVAEVLYHWRAHMGSTAAVADQKPASFNASVRAVREHCDRTGIDADVSEGFSGAVRVTRRVLGNPLVSLLIPTYGKSVQLRGRTEHLITHLIQSVERQTTYENIEYVIIGDTRMDAETVAELTAACGRPVTYIDYEQPATGFNFSEKVNIAATRARGDYLVLVNDDLEILTPSWIEELLGHAQQSDVGAVGGLYYFEDDTIQHAGVVTVMGAYHQFYRHPRGEQVFGHHLAVVRETSVLTGACLMVSRADFFRVGGFTQALPNNFNDVDFCLKLRADGLRNIWTPYVEMYHFESQSRVNHVHEFESDVLRRRWGTRLLKDPYYNPNLKPADGTWTPFEDWDVVSRSWAAPIADLDEVDVEGYLEVNDDLAAEVLRNPAFDAMAHLRAFGGREGRLHIARRLRPESDRNRRSRVRVTEANFTVEGYLSANPDLASHAERNPDWDVRAHLLEHGVAERRFTFLEWDEQPVGR